MDWDITAGATGPTSVFHPYDAHDLPNILDNWPPIQGGNRDDLVFPVPMEFSQWESEFVQDPVPLHVPRTVGPIPPLTRSRRRESQTFPTVLLPGRAPPHRPLRSPRPHPRHHTGSESPQLQHVASRLESRLRRARPRLREALQMADGTTASSLTPPIHSPPQSDNLTSSANPTCVVCFDDIQTAAISAPCSHTFDVECAEALINNALKDESLYPPKCCGRPIPVQSVEGHIDAAITSLWKDKHTELSTPLRVYCAKKTCSRFLGPRTSGDAAPDALNCSKCSMFTCSSCLSEVAEGDRDGHSCTESETEAQVRQLAGDQRWATCPGCKTLVELSMGCNHVFCRCGTQFCYVCHQKWEACQCSGSMMRIRRHMATLRRRQSAVNSKREHPYRRPPTQRATGSASDSPTSETSSPILDNTFFPILPSYTVGASPNLPHYSPNPPAAASPRISPFISYMNALTSSYEEALVRGEPTDQILSEHRALIRQQHELSYPPISPHSPNVLDAQAPSVVPTGETPSFHPNRITDVNEHQAFSVGTSQDVPPFLSADFFLSTLPHLYPSSSGSRRYTHGDNF